MREIELSHDRIVVRRSVRGIKMAVNLPLAAYLGVALRLEPPAGSDTAAATIALEHRDGGLSVPLYRTEDGTDIMAEWQSWGRALRLPLLVADPDGSLREPFERIGAVRVAASVARRRRRTAIKARRPRQFARRRTGALPLAPVIYKDEREIIARN